MAGPFYNPQAGMGIEAAGASAVVSPVAPVTISGADAVTAGLNLATKGVSLYGQYQRSQGSGGTRSGRPDPNVSVFAEEMNKVEQIRSEKGDLAGRLAERAVASNFAAAGVSFGDKAYKSVYESTTGRSFDVYGRDDDEYFKQKQLERPEVQAAFLASKAILPEGTSTESALEWSVNEAAEQGAAAFALNKAQSDATVAWQVGGEKDSGSSKAFRKIRSSFMAGTLGGLLQRFESGQLITPKDIADAKVQWTAISAGPLRRPPSLSGAAGDAQWKAFEDGNESINKFFTTLTDASSSKTLLDTQISILADAVNKSDGMSALEKTVATAGLLNGKAEVYDSLVGGQLGNLYKKLSNVKIPPTSSPEAINRDPVKGISYQISEEEAAKFQGMTGMDISDQIVATAGHAKVFDPSSIGNAQNQVTFGETMTGMIAALQSSNQEDFFSPSYLKEHVLSPKILATLEAYKKSDPDQADKLRGGLQLGYQMEKMRQLQNLSSIETGDLAKFTRFNEQTNSYELNVDAFGTGFGKDIVAFNDALGAYNNNLSEAAKDGFNKFYQASGRVDFGQMSGDVGNPLNIISSAKLAGLTSAVKRRDAIAALDKGISDLSLESGETELGQGQTMDQAPPPPPAVVQPADQGIDISPRPTDQGIDISPRPTDEEDGRSLLQRGLDLIFSRAAAAELTPELRAQLEAVRTRLPQNDIPPLPEAELGSAEALETEAAKATFYPPFVLNDKNFDKNFDLDRKTYKAYPTAFTQTSLNEDDTPKGQRFEPHIDEGNVFTFGGGVTNLKNIKWTGENKYGFEKDKFYNKNQIQNKIEANSGSKGEILKGLDTSKAVETSSGLRREKFGDNKSFAYAVYLSYQDRLTDKLETYGLDTSKLNKNVSGALTDYFWNVEEFFKTKNSSGVRIAKAYIDGDEDWYKKAWEGAKAMLDNIKSVGKPTFGIAKRRAIEYNMMGPPEGKGIAEITLDKDKLNYIAEDGSTLYSRPGKVTTNANLNDVAKVIQAARVDNTPSLSPGEAELNTDLNPSGPGINISPRPKN